MFMLPYTDICTYMEATTLSGLVFITFFGGRVGGGVSLASNDLAIFPSPDYFLVSHCFLFVYFLGYWGC